MKTRRSSKRKAEAKPKAAEAVTKEIPMKPKPRLDIPGLTAGSYGMQADPDSFGVDDYSERRYATAARYSQPPSPNQRLHSPAPAVPKSFPAGNVHGGPVHPVSGAAAFPIPPAGLLPPGPPPPQLFRNFNSPAANIPRPPHQAFMTWKERRELATELSSGNLLKQIFRAPPDTSNERRPMSWDERRSIADALRNNDTSRQAHALLKEHEDEQRYMYERLFGIRSFLPPEPRISLPMGYPTPQRKGEKRTPKEGKPLSRPPQKTQNGYVVYQPKKSASVPHAAPKRNDESGKSSASTVDRPPPQEKDDFSALNILTQAAESITRAGKPAPSVSLISDTKKRVYIDQPTKWDILAGSLSIDHKGNKRFSKIVSYTLPKYEGAARDKQAQICRELVQGVNLYGGRFVKYDNDAKKYYLMTKDETLKLTHNFLDSKCSS